MSLKTEIQAQIAVLQGKLAILNQAPTDNFPFGTVVVFSAATGSKWYYVKTAEETWTEMSGSESSDLASWILTTHESNIGYFEVYVLLTQVNPIYASE